MAVLYRTVPFTRNLMLKVISRNFSSLNISKESCETETVSNCQVLVSTSQNIFENLAFEDWLYKNGEFISTEYLLMWRNHPAIVLGRHQNPWMEANIPAARNQGIDIARRASGGGTVYQDTGNLNLSFLTSRARYNRRRNLDLVVSALRSCGDIDLRVNCRDDLVLDTFYKISGTASKLGRLESYHHFTILHSLDMGCLQGLLESPMKLGVETRSTKSVPAPVMNLTDMLPDLTFDSMIEVIGQHFLEATNYQVNTRDMQLIDPVCEEQYPGVTNLLDNILSWNWIYGKTPKFSVCRNFSGHYFEDTDCSVEVTICVEKGAVTSVDLHTNTTQISDLVLFVSKYYKEHLIGEELTLECIKESRQTFNIFIEKAFGGKGSSIYKGARWLSDRVITCFNFL